MGPEGAVNIIFRSEHRGAAGRRDERRARLIDDYREKFANPFSAAELGYIDEVIVPQETRAEGDPRAGDAEGQARRSNPPRKHGNIPL